MERMQSNFILNKSLIPTFIVGGGMKEHSQSYVTDLPAVQDYGRR